MPRILLLLVFILSIFYAKAQITEVRTFNFDSSNKKDTMIDFPDIQAEKIIMQYTMRCKDGLVSTGTDRNKGCGEWDYSCNTFITDSSRIDSSLATAPSHIISNYNDNLFSFVYQPTYTYIQRTLKNVVETGIASEVKKTVGSGALSVAAGETYPAAQRHLYLFTKEELGAFGGKIVALELDVKKGGGQLSYLRIRMGETDATSVSEFYAPASNTVEVKFENVAVPLSGTWRLPFYSPFTWSGSKNIIVEINYFNPGNDLELSGNQVQMERTAVSNKGDKYWKSDGRSILSIPADEAASIQNEITIAFWSYGNLDVLPANTVALEGVDEKNNRQLMIHLPWSNSNVFWDCGNDGAGYNRINKAALNPEFEGKWHFWTFTKNAITGSMKIYLDGVLWHSATGMTKKINLKKISFGGSLDRSLSYPGFLDDLSVWNKELDVSAIKQLMQTRIDGSNPDYGKLVYYYDFDRNDQLNVADLSAPATTASFTNETVISEFLPGSLFKNFKATAFRPNTTFVKGNIFLQTTQETVLDSFINPGHTVRTFYVENNDLKEGPTLKLWQAGDNPVYNEEGQLVDQIFTDADSFIYIENLVYYSKRPMKFELLSFVTPYGIGLNFGLGGKTWYFDVSDFAPVLKGRKRMTMEFGGQNQEEMDIRFLYYPGKAPREVVDVRQIWPVNSVGFNSIISNNSYEKRSMTFHADTRYAKIRTAITGHGQEGEFIPQTHFININGGPSEWSWQVWKECADNPVYPQGGTWIYDRAGWCPGAPTDLREYDVSSYIANGSIEVDYGVNTAQGDSRYIVNNQLVEYGPAAFQHDASVERIISPSSGDEFARVNPVCMQPEIEIKNTGSANLTSAVIQYGVAGSQFKTYLWSGNLKFMEKARVKLPALDPGNWLEAGQFTAEIKAPNGQMDEYAQNNVAISSFKKAPKFKSEVIIQMRTNGASNETSWTLTDVDGNVIRQRKGGLLPNTEYNDTLKNLGGCYFLKISDSGDDGISFWNNADGTGFLGIRSIGEANQQFQGDFGKEVNFQFLAGDVTTDITEVTASEIISVYPNPANDEAVIEIQGINQPIAVQVIDINGKSLMAEQRENRPHHSISIDLNEFSSGIYFVRILYGNQQKVLKFIRM